ncbi:MAG: sulfatase-like hydrolase/transferase [Acholeplasmatales bacterium]|nr:sulfatase-like hydrolase/transferase [Acholeplasmatales bacterium]
MEAPDKQKKLINWKTSIYKNYTLFFFAATLFILLFKNLILQSYTYGNRFEIDILGGIKSIHFFFFLQLAIFALVLSIGFIFKKKGSLIYFFSINIFVTILCFIDTCYARFFYGVPSIYYLFMPLRTGTGTSFNLWNYFAWGDIFYLIDIPFFIYLLVFGIRNKLYREIKIKKAIVQAAGFLFVIMMTVPLVFNSNMYSNRSTLYQSRIYGNLAYHIIDIFSMFNFENKILLDDEQVDEINEYYSINDENLENNEYYAVFEGKNVIIIQMESIENFVIGNEIDGQEITPNINNMLNNSYYFSNLHEQVKEGNSSDCDLMIMTGLLPVDKGVSFTHYGDNNYNSLAKNFKSQGYNTFYVNGCEESTWNYKGVMTSTMGFDGHEYYVDTYNTDQYINGYIDDYVTLDYIYNKAKALDTKGNYYIHGVLASSHMEFNIPEDKHELILDEETLGIMANYLHAAHYVDKQIGIFVEKLKNDNLLDDTILVIMGDHGGIHKYFPEVDELAEEYEEYEFMGTSQDYTVPTFIYNPSIEGKEFIVNGGQIDINPSLYYAFGFDKSTYINHSIGRNLFNTNRDYYVNTFGEIIYDPETANITIEERDILKKAFYISDLIQRSRYFNKK